MTSLICRDKSVAKLFGDLREDNKKLLSEREQLRQLLEDREEDVKAMREELAHSRKAVGVEQERLMNKEVVGEMVQRLEMLQQKYSTLKQDLQVKNDYKKHIRHHLRPSCCVSLQSLLDEKEDLVQERDAYKCKIHRLNFAMSALLKSDGYQTLDLDWLLAENRYLQQSVAQLEAEKQLANEMGRRYKSTLEQASTRPSPQESSSSVEQKIASLLAKTSFPCPAKLDLSSLSSLHELCLSLMETLGDRMLQLKHQRRANKHILDRLAQFEQKMVGLEHGELLAHPSQFLMSGYSGADVDVADAEALLTTRKSSFIAEVEASSTTSSSSSQQDMLTVETTTKPLNPPDIIAEGIPRPHVTAHTSREGEEEAGDESAVRDDVLEESIVLPDHLQSLVDKAMKELSQETQ